MITNHSNLLLTAPCAAVVVRGGGRGHSAVTGTNQRRFRNPAGANRAGFLSPLARIRRLAKDNYDERIGHHNTT